MNEQGGSPCNYKAELIIFLTNHVSYITIQCTSIKLTSVRLAVSSLVSESICELVLYQYPSLLPAVGGGRGGKGHKKKIFFYETEKKFSNNYRKYGTMLCTHAHVYTYRLKDPFLFSSSFLPLLLELPQVLREDKRLWNKVTVSLPNSSLKPREVTPKTVLSTNLESSREMIDLCKQNNYTRKANYILCSIVGSITPSMLYVHS